MNKTYIYEFVMEKILFIIFCYLELAEKKTKFVIQKRITFLKKLKNIQEKNKFSISNE